MVLMEVMIITAHTVHASVPVESARRFGHALAAAKQQPPRRPARQPHWQSLVSGQPKADLDRSCAANGFGEHHIWSLSGLL